MKTIEGSKAVCDAVVNCEPEVVACYPITPSTHIAEDLNKAYMDGKLKTYVAVESEFAAISTIVGGSAAGSRVFSTTSSQGLALMHEIIFASAGMRVPLVMVVANRSLSAPLNIWNDHQDSISERDAGWVQLYCETNQEATDTIPLAFRIAEELMIPVMVCMDGFYLTHAVEQLTVPEKEIIQKFLPPFNPEIKLDPKNPMTMGVYAKPDNYQEFRNSLDSDMFKAIETIEKRSKEWGKLISREYGNGIIEEYQTDDAERVLIALSSVCGNIKEAVDELRRKGEKVGLLRIKCFRPFPYKEIKKVLQGKKHVGVIEKAMSAGAYPPMYVDIVSAMYGETIPISYFIGGLGGRDITVEHCKELFEKLKEKPVKKWILENSNSKE
ncbi:pyruvate ferredoxin oxidoreductase [Candidatus Micrarchaeota archaeon]|nr:pyruvate ferredoxin oxidoreductase [Candidatus Micrarchaeota archaeon]